jgi:hypothetical protein
MSRKIGLAGSAIALFLSVGFHGALAQTTVTNVAIPLNT